MEPIVIRMNNTLRKHLGDELIVRYDSRCEALESKHAFWFVLLVRPNRILGSRWGGASKQAGLCLSQAFWFVLLVRPNPRRQQVGHQNEQDFLWFKNGVQIPVSNKIYNLFENAWRRTTRRTTKNCCPCTLMKNVRMLIPTHSELHSLFCIAYLLTPVPVRIHHPPGPSPGPHMDKPFVVCHLFC